MTNYCRNCDHQDHESNLVFQLGGGYLCNPCHEKNKIDHPSHYQGKGLECIQVIESFNLGFHKGNSIKYILRSGKKEDHVADLRKAIWYLEREIENLEGKNARPD